MRAPTLVVVVIALVVAGSCGSSEAASKSTDGALLLEVGGANGSLREALSAAGVAMGEGRRLRRAGADADVEPRPVVPAPAPTAEPGQPVAEPEPPTPAAPSLAPPVPRFKVVVLERGQTAIHLAKIHLGNGNRFPEILAANGWTEAQARRLLEGTKVKVPIDDRGAGNHNR